MAPPYPNLSWVTTPLPRIFPATYTFIGSNSNLLVFCFLIVNFASGQNNLILQTPSLPKRHINKRSNINKNDHFPEVISFLILEKRTWALEPLPPAYVLYAHDNDENLDDPLRKWQTVCDKTLNQNSILILQETFWPKFWTQKSFEPPLPPCRSKYMRGAPRHWVHTWPMPMGKCWHFQKTCCKEEKEGL